MIKIIQAISIVIFGISSFLLVRAVVFGAHRDPKIQEFIKQPGAAEILASDKDATTTKDDSQTSPLVAQAAALSETLNPKPPPVPVSPVTQPSAPVPMTQTITPKFNLVGTSYYPGKPGTSFALIDEPGQGLYWVREGNSVGHLLIDKVNDGSVTIRDGSRTFEMNVTVKELWRNLIKGASENLPSASSDTSAESQRISPAAAPAALSPGAAPPAISRPGTRTRQVDAAALRRAGRNAQPAALNESTPENPVTQQTIEPPQPSPAEQAASIAALKETLRKQLNDAKTSRVSPEEAKQMEELAEALNKLETIESQNADPNG
jgi:hypothetical protein